MGRLLPAAAAISLVTTMACGGSGAGGNKAAADGTNRSASRSAPSAAPAASQAAEGEVRALLEEIYAPYTRDNAPGREIAGLMEPQLAQAMSHSPEGLNADPFIDAQDYEAFRPIYQSVRVNGDRAEASVGINSMGERTITYQFVRIGDDWKIADIRSAGGGSLRSQYQLQPLQ